MKKNFTLFFLGFVTLIFAQAGAPASPYYDGMNWTLTGMNLKNALSNKIITTHTNFLTYTPGVWEAARITDLDPNNSNNVLLLYGFSNDVCPTSPSNDNDHRSRDKFSNGGGTSCEWNREHVFAKALGSPALDDGGASDAGEDAHHLRASDVDRNNSRGNLKFTTGSGNSGAISGGWYPGDEWKGDVARMMMYMYLRYPTQCLPINVGTGATVAIDPNMIQLFLQWNAEDPVSQYEDNRNTYHGNAANTYGQGNRNPFIDNPYLATVIWGGPVAENRWPSVFLSSESFASIDNVEIYPNPTINNEFSISSEIELKSIVLYNINGQIIQEIKNPTRVDASYKVSNLQTGFYLVQMTSENGSATKKVIVN
ncbi:endonuclease [Flavobacterium channae]|uniref:endonuclease n=1 Tax=Flavobacterium channae TaxID=2897181 RepID=UPI001E327A9F|nr:endonuclease [Flavobacterium channae]UGS24788.1 endonuclease [Flavobacterium channae]